MWLPIIAAKLDKAELYNVIALETTQESKLEDGIAWCLYTSSIIALNKGQWEHAIVQLEELLNMKHIWYTMTAVDGIVALIMAYQLTGQTEKASNLLKDLERFVNDLNPFYQQFLWAAKARYYTLIGESDLLKRIIGTQQVISLGNPVLYYDVPVNTECRALIFEGSKPGLKLAEEKLQGLIAISKGQYNVLHWIELLVYQAILFDKQGRIEKSTESLLKAIELAEPGKVKACFVEMGKPILEILDKMPDEKKEIAYLQDLINTISTTPFYQMDSIVKEPIHKERLNILTQREMEVLQCIAEGLSNQEIAAKLFNSEETIKKHISNMFQKMYVKNRLSLVTKAKEQDLLK
jgi:LuxR family maltose regulon positive regulatory protein